jgi:hypothetical protein
MKNWLTNSEKKEQQSVPVFSGYAREFTEPAFHATSRNQPVFHPSGKPGIPHLLLCQGFAVAYYSFTLSASDLHHPRLLQH